MRYAELPRARDEFTNSAGAERVGLRILSYSPQMPEGLTLSQFKGVFFDIDGTLVDSLPALIRGLGDAYERYNGVRPSDSEIEALIGMPLRVQLGLFRAVPPTPEELKEMTAYTIERFEANAHLERVYEPAVEALRLTHCAGLKTALITSKSDVEVQLLTERFEASKYADTVVNASDVVHPKPDPEAALLACARLNVEPGEAVFIGDSVFDIRCAKDAGCAAVAVAYGSGKREALIAEQPDLLFETPNELLDWARNSLLTPSCPERK